MTRAHARYRSLPALGFACLMLSCSAEKPAPGAEAVAADEADIAARMIAAIERGTLARAENGVVPRFNQAKSLGCLEADFVVDAALPPELRQGLFAQAGSHRAVVRFANASEPDDRDKDFRGMSIKVFDVAGPSLWGESGQQDFLLNSYPALFAADPAEFLAFVEATADAALWKFFIDPRNWDSLLLLLKGREEIVSPFDISYWSTTPYRLGLDPGVAAKYAAYSCTAMPGEMPAEPDADFLRTVMQRQLQGGEACFDFLVQLQGDPGEMPIENASVVWDEEASPYRKVARLRIAAQDFAAPAALQACERQRFNPWQSLEEHRPLGGINRVRRDVYAEAGDFRLRQSR